MFLPLICQNKFARGLQQNCRKDINFNLITRLPFIDIDARKVQMQLCWFLTWLNQHAAFPENLWQWGLKDWFDTESPFWTKVWLMAMVKKTLYGLNTSLCLFKWGLVDLPQDFFWRLLVCVHWVDWPQYRHLQQLLLLLLMDFFCLFNMCGSTVLCHLSSVSCTIPHHSPTVPCTVLCHSWSWSAYRPVPLATVPWVRFVKTGRCHETAMQDSRRVQEYCGQVARRDRAQVHRRQCCSCYCCCYCLSKEERASPCTLYSSYLFKVDTSSHCRSLSSPVL